MGEKIARECQGIYPMQNVFIRKVKVMKSPKFDAYKFSELHAADASAPIIGATPVSLGEDTGAAVDRAPVVGEDGVAQ